MTTSRGFTLIEVLIAAIILFSAIALTAQVYSASTLSAQKAARTAEIYQFAGVAVDQVKQQLRMNPQAQNAASNVSGELEIGGVRFLWRAQLVNKLAPQRDYDEAFDPPERFWLYQVDLEAEHRGSIGRFQVVVW